jgi:pre-rRNA-processing protein TSR4
MVLLLQLNGELPEFPGHERRLYILTCRRKTCRRKEGCVRVLRGVRITAVEEKQEVRKEQARIDSKPVLIGESLFGATPLARPGSNPFALKSNPFSTSMPTGNANPFASAGLPATKIAVNPSPPPTSTKDVSQTFAAAVSFNIEPPRFGPPPPSKPWPEIFAQPPPYPLYYLDPDYEELDAVPAIDVPTQILNLDDISGGAGGKEDKEVFESTIDKAFQKFADRLAQNPEQVLRYEFRGMPLLYSKEDAVGKSLSGMNYNSKVKTSGISACSNCGAQRVFEVQLTPFAILELEREESGIDGMEWGTIIVGVCERDCQRSGIDEGAVGYIEEWVGVQWEELK